MSLIWPF
jgi:hypothetical protein